MGFADTGVLLTVDATFAAYGAVASYSPPGGGDAVACVVCRKVPDRALGFGQGAPLLQSDEIEVRKSEVSAPARGGLFTVGTEVLEILSDPRCEDDLALVWIMTVR
jgi:hypothetical protein